jgi:hypothetical protein
MMNVVMLAWPTWYRLSTVGQKAEARVTAIQPELHQTCHFEFPVGATTRDGSASGCPAAVGDVVDITYLPNDPTFTTLRDPKEELVGEVVGSLGMSAFAGLVAGMRAKSRRQKQP